MVAVAPRTIRAALLGAAFFGLASSAESQFLQEYKQGLKAAEDGDWRAAADAMRRAIAERPEEKASLPGRVYLKPYLPHYQLGVALFELGDCEGARGAWNEAERQGVISGRPEIGVVREKRAECERRERAATLAAAERAASEALSGADRASAALQAFASSQGATLWAEAKSSFRERQRGADDRLAAARRRSAEALRSADTAALAEAASLARRAATDFEDLRRDGLRRLAELDAQLGNQRSRIETLTADARSLLERTAPYAPHGAQIRRARADLEGLLGEQERALAVGDQRYLQGLASRLAFSMQQLETLAAPPPPLLTNAAEGFLRGDYAKVLELLADLPPEDPRARAHALLLRAAARYQLWVEGGESDAEILAAATADAAQCRRTNPALAPPGPFFSPRFRALFDGVRADGARAQ